MRSAISNKYKYASSFWPCFTIPETEKEYVDAIATNNAMRINVSTSLIMVGMLIVQVIVPKSLGLSLFLRVSFVVVCIILRFTPLRYREIAVIGAETYLLLAALFLNKFRLLRHSIIDEQAEAAYDKVWDDCSYDLTIHSRDSIEMLGIISLQIVFLFFRTRSAISWIPPACTSLAFTCLLSVSSFRLNDGGGTVILFFFLIGASSALWLLSVFNERDHRELWALGRIRETEAEWQKEFVNIVFTVVVHVQRGRILQASALEPHFGVMVSDVSDLSSRKDNGDYELAIVDLVNEVEITGKPAKRNLLIRPKDVDLVFDCTVCAFFLLDGGATILGFEIRESRPEYLLPDENPSIDMSENSILDRGETPGGIRGERPQAERSC